MDINNSQKQKLINPLLEYFNGDIKGKKIAIWGLAFKPYTDDIREAPSLENINKLLELGADLKVYDPEAMNNVKGQIGDIVTYCKDEYEAAEGADALMIMTEWPVFRTPEFDKLKNSLNNPVIFDGRNLYEVNQMKDLGFTYFSVGRHNLS